MITLDRDSGVAISAQIARQLRFLIASGRYQVGDLVPSTRALADRLGVSFHTVRKAYASLAEAGLLEPVGGRGFVVVSAKSGSTSDRLEEGAEIAAEAIQRLLATGLNEQEVEALLFEQLEEQLQSVSAPGVLFAASYRELAERCSELVQSVVSASVTPVLLRDLESHVDAEFVITPFAHLSTAMRSAPHAQAIGVTVFYAHELQASLARLTSHDAVAIAVQDPTSVEPIMIDIRRLTGFSGQVFGIAANADADEFESILEQVDLVLYTHQSRRRVRGKLGDHASVELDPRIAGESLDVVRRMLTH